MASEEAKLLTLSQIFDKVPPPKILTYLRQCNGQMEFAADRLLTESHSIKEPSAPPKKPQKPTRRKQNRKPPPPPPQYRLRDRQPEPNPVQQATPKPLAIDGSSIQAPLSPLVVTDPALTKSELELTRLNEFGNIKKLQQQLDQVYEKSFEVMETKIVAQAKEIDALTKQVQMRDEEIVQLKKKRGDSSARTFKGSAYR